MKNLKLNALASKNLSKVEMNQLTGGHGCCSCACAYASSGGSSTNANGSANQKGNLHSKPLDGIIVCGNMGRVSTNEVRQMTSI